MQVNLLRKDHLPWMDNYFLLNTSLSWGNRWCKLSQYNGACKFVHNLIFLLIALMVMFTNHSFQIWSDCPIWYWVFCDSQGVGFLSFAGESIWYFLLYQYILISFSGLVSRHWGILDVLMLIQVGALRSFFILSTLEHSRNLVFSKNWAKKHVHGAWIRTHDMVIFGK